jgi:hypothetical protein
MVQPRPDMLIEDQSLPGIYTPVDAYLIRGELYVFFLTGEYDRDDARLLAVIARYKSRVAPICRAVFLNAPDQGEAVRWLADPTYGAAIAAAAYQAGHDDPLNPTLPAEGLLQAFDRLFQLRPARMGEGLAQVDAVLTEHLFPFWTLSAQGRDLIRPLVRALNYLLRRALNDALPGEVEWRDEPLMAERVRLWKKGETWYRFQSLEYAEDMFRQRKAGLKAAYDGLYNLCQSPECQVDRVHLRVLTAPVDPQNPDKPPFVTGASGGSSLRGEFLAARRAMLEQHGLNAPDLIWAVAECGACKSRSRFRDDADPLSLYTVSQTMERIKQMLVGSRGRDTYRCTRCRQPLGFDHLVLAAYATRLSDLELDLHFLNEKRPGRRRTFIQTLHGEDLNCRAMAVTDDAVAKIASRPLTAVGLWRALLHETTTAPKWREFLPGLVGLCLPPAEQFRQSSLIARFQDQLVARSSSYWPVQLKGAAMPDLSLPGGPQFPQWLGPLAPKVSGEREYLLVAFVEMDRIEALFMRSAKGLGLNLNRAFDGTIEVRGGAELTLAVDLKLPVTIAIQRGHFPGVFAAREAGRQARLISAAQRTLAAIRQYLGRDYSVSYVPTTKEVQVQGPYGLPAGFPLDVLVREWARDNKKVKQMILAKAGG